MLDVLAPITPRASGRVGVELHADGRRFRFTAPIDSAAPRASADRQRPRAGVSALARGVVRLQLEYSAAVRRRCCASPRIRGDGRWSLNEKLSETALQGIAQRQGTVHSYTLFTGYHQRRMRGEMPSLQVLGDR